MEAERRFQFRDVSGDRIEGFGSQVIEKESRKSIVKVERGSEIDC